MARESSVNIGGYNSKHSLNNSNYELMLAFFEGHMYDGPPATDGRGYLP